MLDWLTDLLREERYEVKTAARGQSAEDAFFAFSPDVVLTDLLLPDLDGLELLRRFKRLPRPVEAIVLTGHASIPKAVECMRAGAFAFVEKPVEPEVLLVTVRNAVEHCRLRSENQDLRQQLNASSTSRASSAATGWCIASWKWCERRAERGELPHRRRERHGQGAGGERDPRPEPSREGPVHQGELRGDSRRS